MKNQKTVVAIRLTEYADKIGADIIVRRVSASGQTKSFFACAFAKLFAINKSNNIMAGQSGIGSTYWEAMANYAIKIRGKILRSSITQRQFRAPKNLVG